MALDPNDPYAALDFEGAGSAAYWPIGAEPPWLVTPTPPPEQPDPMAFAGGAPELDPAGMAPPPMPAQSIGLDGPAPGLPSYTDSAPPMPEPMPAPVDVAAPAPTVVPISPFAAPVAEPEPPIEGSFVDWAKKGLRGEGEPAEIDFGTAEQAEAAADQDVASRALDIYNDPNYELHKFQREDDARLRQQALEADVVREDAKARIESARVYSAAMATAKKARAEVNAAAKALAEDPETWFSKQSAGIQIAGFISAAISGWLDPGGKNGAIELISQANERDIARRQAGIAQQGDAADQLFADANTSAQAADMLRVATFQAAKEQVLTKMQEFDPMGDQAQRMADLARQLDAQSAQAEQSAYDANLDREIKRGEFMLKVAKEEREAGKFAGVGVGGGGGGAGVVGGAGSLTPEQWEAYGGARPPAPMTPKQYDAWARRAGSARKWREEDEKKVRELGIGTTSQVERDDTGAVVLADDGLPKIRHGGALLEQDGGSPFLAATPEQAKDIVLKMSAAHSISNIINEVLAIRDRTGGESEWGNSDDYQRLKVLQNQLVVLTKQGTEGMSSDEDMKKLISSVGASDVTSFRARAAGLREGLKHTTEHLNTFLQYNKYSGKTVTFPNPYAGGGRKRTSDEESFKRNLGWQTDQYAYGKSAGTLKSIGSKRPDEDARGYSKKQEAYVDGLAKTLDDANAAPEKRESARTQLELVEANADSPGLKAYARARLSALAEQSKATAKTEGQRFVEETGGFK